MIITKRSSTSFRYTNLNIPVKQQQLRTGNTNYYFLKFDAELQLKEIKGKT